MANDKYDSNLGDKEDRIEVVNQIVYYYCSLAVCCLFLKNLTIWIPFFDTF